MFCVGNDLHVFSRKALDLVVIHLVLKTVQFLIQQQEISIQMETRGQVSV
jgi:hypothetical protein